MSCNYNCNERVNPCYDPPTKGCCPPPPSNCFAPGCDPCCNTCCDNSKGPCCTGLTINKFNPSQAETIFAYVDRIFDGKIGPGSALVEQITTTTVAYTTETQYSACGTNCCGTGATCNVAVGSVYTIENIVSEILDLKINVTIPKGSVMVNGTSIPNDVINNGDGTYTASLGTSNALPNELCRNYGDKKCCGTKSTVMLNSIAGWTYVARHTITGKVNSNGQMCNFCTTIQDVAAGHTLPVATTSTLIIQELCIPSIKSTLTFSFKGKITLLNPVLTAEAIDPTNAAAGTRVKMVATSIVTPEIIGEVVERTRACLQVML